jgi:hypothetical protein
MDINYWLPSMHWYQLYHKKESTEDRDNVTGFPNPTHAFPSFKKHHPVAALNWSKPLSWPATSQIVRELMENATLRRFQHPAGRGEKGGG